MKIYSDFTTLICAIAMFGAVRCDLIPCSSDQNTVYLSEGDCSYLCSVQKVINGYLLCKTDRRTVVLCPEENELEELKVKICSKLRCEVTYSSSCHGRPTLVYKEVLFVPSLASNMSGQPIYINPEAKPNNRMIIGDFPRITFEEPSSQMYGILSFFFGVITFFLFALVFRFFYKRYQHHPMHVHTFSGHQLPLGSLQQRSFLSPSPNLPQTNFPQNEQAGIPGLDLPPSYVVASELLDPPPSYEDVSKMKMHPAQSTITSL